MIWNIWLRKVDDIVEEMLGIPLEKFYTDQFKS